MQIYCFLFLISDFQKKLPCLINFSFDNVCRFFNILISVEQTIDLPINGQVIKFFVFAILESHLFCLAIVIWLFSSSSLKW